MTIQRQFGKLKKVMEGNTTTYQYSQLAVLLYSYIDLLYSLIWVATVSQKHLLHNLPVHCTSRCLPFGDVWKPVKLILAADWMTLVATCCNEAMFWPPAVATSCQFVRWGKPWRRGLAADDRGNQMRCWRNKFFYLNLTTSRYSKCWFSSLSPGKAQQNLLLINDDQTFRNNLNDRKQKLLKMCYLRQPF